MLLCLKKTFTCLKGRSVLGWPARRVISRVGPGCYCLEVWCGLGDVGALNWYRNLMMATTGRNM